ncbi:MAG: hypothetical protein EOP49_36930, partial [Sphingobacteriales bacterium]
MGGAYEWVNPGGNVASTQQNPCIVNASPAHNGVYTVYVTNANGCRSLPAYVTIQVNPLPAVDATSNSPLCEGQTLVLSTPMVQGATYSWTGPSAMDPFYSTQRIPTRSNIQLQHSGTHEVIVTDANGCTATDTVQVQVNPQPSAPSILSNAIPNGICAGQTLCFYSSGNYITPSGQSFAGPFCIPNAQLSDAGTFTSTITINGCSSPPASESITIKPSPDVQAIAFDTLINSGDTTVLKATGANSNYQWSAINPATAGLPPNQAIPQIQVSPAVTTTYMVVGTNTNQCSDTAYVTV